jgi:hypothetical protein
MADSLRQPLPVARDHPLRPDGEAEEFHGLVRPEEHPHREPCRAVAVEGGDDDDDEEF